MTSFRGSCFDDRMSTDGAKLSMNAWSSSLMAGSYCPEYHQISREPRGEGRTRDRKDAVPDREELRRCCGEMQLGPGHAPLVKLPVDTAIELHVSDVGHPTHLVQLGIGGVDEAEVAGLAVSQQRLIDMLQGIAKLLHKLVFVRRLGRLQASALARLATPTESLAISSCHAAGISCHAISIRSVRGRLLSMMLRHLKCQPTAESRDGDRLLLHPGYTGSNELPTNQLRLADQPRPVRHRADVVHDHPRGVFVLLPLGLTCGEQRPYDRVREMRSNVLQQADEHAL